MVYCIHSTEYCLDSHGTAWMNLKNMLRERYQAQKATNCVIQHIQNGPEESKLVMPRVGVGWGCGVLKGRGFLSGVMKML